MFTVVGCWLEGIQLAQGGAKPCERKVDVIRTADQIALIRL